MKEKPKILKLAGKLLLYSGIVGIGVTLILVFYLNAKSKQVVLIVPHDPIVIETNKSMFTSGDDVIEIYGNSLSGKTKVVILDDKKLIRPTEDPNLLLMPVDKQKSENPLQWQTVELILWPVLIAFLIDALIGYFLIRKSNFSSKNDSQ